MRAFFALPITGSLQQQLVEQQLHLQSQIADLSLRWVPAQNFHLTMAFLADITTTDIAELAERAVCVASRHKALALTVAELSWFPSAAKPRCLAALLAKSAALKTLQRDLIEQLIQCAVVLPSGSFRPHITLAAASSGFQAGAFVAHNEPMRAVINELVLYESQPQPAYNHYRPIHAWPLAGSATPAA